MRPVCRRWSAIISQICVTKRQLKLFDNYESLFKYCMQLIELDRVNEFALKETGLDDDLVFNFGAKRTALKKISCGQFIANLFPAVEKLVICFYYSELSQLLQSLLQHSPRLTSLVLFSGLFQDLTGESQISQQINSLNYLKIFENLPIAICEIPYSEEWLDCAGHHRVNEAYIKGRIYPLFLLKKSC